MFANRDTVPSESPNENKQEEGQSGVREIIIVLILLVAWGTMIDDPEPEPAAQVAVATATATPTPTPTPTPTSQVSLSEYQNDMDSLVSGFRIDNQSVEFSLRVFSPLMDIGGEEDWELWREDHVSFLRDAILATEEIIDYDEDKVPACAEEWHGEMVSGMETWKMGLEQQANALYREDTELLEESVDNISEARRTFEGLSDVELDCGG